MGISTRTKQKTSKLLCIDYANGMKCRSDDKCVFLHGSNGIAVKSLRKTWAAKQKAKKKKQKQEEKKKRKAEKQRQDAEKQRQDAEKQRQDAEKRRQDAERKRRQKAENLEKKKEAQKRKHDEKSQEESDGDLPDLIEEDESEDCSEDELPELVGSESEDNEDSDDNSIPSLVNGSDDESADSFDDEDYSSSNDEGEDDVYYDNVSVHVFEKELDAALNSKAIGNKKFQAKKFEEALKMYQTGLSKLEHVSPKSSASDAVELVHVLFLNCAAAQIELKMYRQAVSSASKSIAFWPRVKAYYRRGTALLRMKRYDHAVKDFKAALKLRPNDSTIKRSLKEAQSHL